MSAAAQLEILTEEESMEIFLQGLLPRLLPREYELNINCFIRPHNGKDNLKKTIPDRMRQYRFHHIPVKVLIIHDQDQADCKALKRQLTELCQPANVPFMIRIPCRELENWYLGDFDAIARAYDSRRVLRHRNRKEYRDCDNTQGKAAMKKLVGGFSQRDAARRMAPHMTVESNNSASFRHFVSGLNKLLSEKSVSSQKSRLPKAHPSSHN